MGLFLLACFPCFMITVSIDLTYYSSRYWYRNILLLINPWPRKLKPANIRILLFRLTAICCSTKGGFPVMAEITRILAANICRQFFFVVTITASTRCLVDNFQLICYSQRVNATSQYNDSGSSRCSKWPNDRMVAVVKHCWPLVQGRRGCRER